MKRGTDAEAELFGRVMPVITCDIFPPADILNSILSEFITARSTVAYNLTPTIFKVKNEAIYCLRAYSLMFDFRSSGRHVLRASKV